VADYFNVVTKCDLKVDYCESYGVWYYHDPNVGKDTFVRPNAGDGCRRPPMYGYQELCMDWNNKRGHFIDRQSVRRCIAQRGQVNVKSGLDLSTWPEVPCTW
jgi:hypothetical protein